MMEPYKAQFRFYEELNDFLPDRRKKIRFIYEFKGNPSVKDAVEALGVPHTEVDLILVNGRSVEFRYLLQNGDDVAVYPVFEGLDISPINRLRPESLRNPAFVLDTQLGKLARHMRMIGLDTLYQNDYQDQEIIQISRKENRIILTRDVSLLKNKSVTRGIWIRSTKSREQLREVIQRLDLKSQIQPFQRCLECNGGIVSIEKDLVIERIPPRTVQYFNDFFQCLDCGKIYWKGSHFQKMQNWIKELIDNILSEK